MSSLISLFLDLFNITFKKKNIIEIKRLPNLKVLRAHLLGISFALLFIIIVAINFTQYWPVALVFIFGTYFGGPFVFVVILFSLFAGTDIFNFDEAINFAERMKILSGWYILGYAFAAILATLYNDAVFFYVRFINPRLTRTSFRFDPQKKINIIKSPDLEEITVKRTVPEMAELIRKAWRVLSEKEQTKLTKRLKLSSDTPMKKILKEKEKLAELGQKEVCEIERLLEGNLNLNCQQLYNFDIKTPPAHPYTIAFVANPWILKYPQSGELPDGFEDYPDNYEKDPIIDNLDLFLSSVDAALQSFESNEVLGRPEIWSRIRVIAIFDPTLAKKKKPRKYALVQPYGAVNLDQNIVENILDPVTSLKDIYERMLKKARLDACLSEEKLASLLRETDVIYALSAVPEYDRSSAHFSDWIENDGGFRIEHDTLDKLKKAGMEQQLLDRFEEPQNSPCLNNLIIGKDKLLKIFNQVIGKEISGQLTQNIIDSTQLKPGDPNPPLFRVTDDTVNQLKENHLPEKIIEILNSEEIKRKIYVGEAAFLNHLRESIKSEKRKRVEAEEIALYEKLILQHTVTNGVLFSFDPDPGRRKRGKIKFAHRPAAKVNEINRQHDNTVYSSDYFSFFHEYYAVNPGRVALNVLSAAPKTYIHEFAHAMSSAYHGAIVDEYFDRFAEQEAINQQQKVDFQSPETPFYVNRIERIRPQNQQVVPVHRIFARYNGTDYFSDRDHPSAEEEWIGYFPDRRSPEIACTMDRTYGAYRFDELIASFMYDRLIAKLNRPAFDTPG